MPTYIVKSLAGLRQRLKRDLTKRERKVHQAIRRTLNKGARIVRRNVPVAFSDLRDSVHVSGTKIVVDAPHAAAVNNGSRPHMPPLEPLIKWVKLRGMQGLAGERVLGRLPGSSTKVAAESIAGQLADYEADGAVSVDAPREIARAIAFAISKRGTKPHHFMEKSEPQVFAVLDAEMKKAFSD